MINQINRIDFNSSKDRHLFNDLYETILKELQSAGSSGEYYTSGGDTVYGGYHRSPTQGNRSRPGFRYGRIPLLAPDHKKKLVQNDQDERDLQATIRGIEKKPLPHLLCTTNLMLHGFDVPAVRRDNLLSKPYADWGASDKVDIILTNPPFGGVEEDGTETISHRSSEPRKQLIYSWP